MAVTMRCARNPDYRGLALRVEGGWPHPRL